MKCLGHDASSRWLSGMGIDIVEHRQLRFPDEHETIVLERPAGSLPLNYFAEALVDWLPQESDRFIWLSDWETYPRSQSCIFERIRGSYGETKPIIESPGHVFAENNETERGLYAGLLFLVMAFDWSGYFLVKGHIDRMHMFDTLIGLTCSLPDKATEVREIADKFKLRVVRTECIRR